MFILTDQQANAIKRKWWFWARFELLAWALFFAFGYSLLEFPLREAHWPAWVYWAIIGCSLLLFSRLAIWATFIVATVAHGIGWAAYSAGHPLFTPVTGYFVCASVAAMVIRSPLGLFMVWSMADSIKAGADHIRSSSLVEEPVYYDARSHEHVYTDGRRERAFLKPKKTNDGDREEDYHRW
jgi:hypothetical protein